MANNDKIEATKVIFGATPGKLIRMSYLTVFRPRANRESGKEDYSVSILIPKTNVEDYQKAVAAFEEQKKLFFPKGSLSPMFHHPIKDGNKDLNTKGVPLNQPGFWVIGAKASAYELTEDKKGQDKSRPTDPPPVVGTIKLANGQLKPLTSREIKSGDWGRISVNFKGYEKGTGGIGVYINSIQKVQDGEAMTGRTSASDEFAEFADIEDENPLG